jgi:hypothetical protein
MKGVHKMLEKLTSHMLRMRDTMVQECIFDLLESVGIKTQDRSFVEMIFIQEELKKNKFQLRIENDVSYEVTISLYRLNGINDEEIVKQWRLLLTDSANIISLEKQLTVDKLDF